MAEGRLMGTELTGHEGLANVTPPVFGQGYVVEVLAVISGSVA